MSNLIEMLNKVSLVRPGPGSWGLRLQGEVGLETVIIIISSTSLSLSHFHRHHIPQGGVDVQKALTIINVADGSPSEMSGLKVDFFQ